MENKLKIGDIVEYIPQDDEISNNFIGVQVEDNKILILDMSYKEIIVKNKNHNDNKFKVLGHLSNPLYPIVYKEFFNGTNGKKYYNWKDKK